MRRMRVPEAQDGSYEDVMHRSGAGDFLLRFGETPERARLHGLDEARGQRAIGVVYDPRHERFGNYVPTILPERYDALIFIDETRALDALHMPVRVDGELPETYPSAM